MAEYKPREGIVATQICDSFVLIPTRAVYDVCKSIQMIPPPWVMLWALLEHGETVERISGYYQMMSRRSEPEIREKIDFILSKLCEKGYLVKIE
ncbi:MAG: hypothetical protein IKQ54_08365 [Oscillospiraceae bacterium]|nr:hypothetical protein [Oscillospiraceae bacterium]